MVRRKAIILSHRGNLGVNLICIIISGMILRKKFLSIIILEKKYMLLDITKIVITPELRGIGPEIGVIGPEIIGGVL